jgi:uncharacterized cupin superfamily protein
MMRSLSLAPALFPAVRPSHAASWPHARRAEEEIVVRVRRAHVVSRSSPSETITAGSLRSFAGIDDKHAAKV